MNVVLGFLACVMADSTRIDLGDGTTLIVPAAFRAGPEGKVDLLIHLHGAVDVLDREAARAGWTGAVVAFNRKGLSSVYTKPFQDPALFGKVIDRALDGLRDAKVVKEPRPGRIVLSSFSAGFGGVREILKRPDDAKRIDVLILADSLYCGYADDRKEAGPDPVLMTPFAVFADRAAEGKTRLLLSHSAQVPGTYASTTETADMLAKRVGGESKPEPAEGWPSGWAPTRHLVRDGFEVLGFAGGGPEDHMRHLREIGLLWKRAAASRP